VVTPPHSIANKRVGRNQKFGLSRLTEQLRASRSILYSNRWFIYAIGDHGGDFEMGRDLGLGERDLGLGENSTLDALAERLNRIEAICRLLRRGAASSYTKQRLADLLTPISICELQPSPIRKPATRLSRPRRLQVINRVLKVVQAGRA
jgi:hypothetical protein